MTASLEARLRVARFGLSALVGLAAAMSLTACAPGEVALEGKIFDAIGVGANSANVKSAEPRMAQRTGLVEPPRLERLPEPGSGAEDDGVLASLDDPDRKKDVNKAELERRQAEFCRVNYEQAKARGDATADTATGPLGPCRASIFTAVEKWNKSE